MDWNTPKRIVITGGPGTGKTAVIEELERSGYHCMHEIIRDMTLKAKAEEDAAPITNPLAFVADPLAFNEKLLEGRQAQFQKAATLKEDLVFFDRGLPDVIAYMDYFKQEYHNAFTRACQEMRYDMVVVLPPWRDIYRQDDGRLEAFEEAVDIHNQLVATYQQCNYEITTLPTGTVVERVSEMLNLVTNRFNSERHP